MKQYIVVMFNIIYGITLLCYIYSGIISLSHRDDARGVAGGCDADKRGCLEVFSEESSYFGD